MSNSQRSSQRARADDLTEEQFQSAVLNVTSYILCEMRSKRKIRKEDIVMNALNKSARQFAAILKIAKENLSEIFGLHLAFLPSKDDAFIVVNKHQAAFFKLTHKKLTDNEIQDDLILSVVLGAIFMNRGQMFESHVIAILENIGFLKANFFVSSCERKIEDVPKLLSTVFVKQMYLEPVSVDRPAQVQHPPLPEDGKKTVAVLKWGFRALLEVDVDKIVDYLTKIHDDKKPPAFPVSYYKELKAEQLQIRNQLTAGQT